MNSTGRWGAIGRGVRNRGREIALVVVLLLINYLIFSRLMVMVSGDRQATSTPTRTPKPTFTPFAVIVDTPTLAPEPTPTEEPSPAASPTVGTHVVESGDTLSGIARMYGTTVDAIVEANDLGSADALIREGQELLIPSSPPPLPTAEGTAVAASSPSSTVGQKIHVVEEGETLSEIARMYGVTTEELAQTNGLDNPNALRAGLALVIP
jgi:LysM repeat protein